MQGIPEQHSLAPSKHLCPAGVHKAALTGRTADEQPLVPASALQINSPDSHSKQLGLGLVDAAFRTGQLSVIVEQTAETHFDSDGIYISLWGQVPHFEASGVARHFTAVSPFSP